MQMFLLGAGPKGAVPLSKATILGGAIGNFLSIGRAKHPKADRPMIDYESSTFMQSGELLGVVFGVLLNNLLPAIAIVIFLVLILSWNSVRTLRKAVGIRRKETAAMDKAASAGKQQEVEYKTVAAVSTSAVDVEAAPSVAAQAAQAASGQTAVHPTDAAAATNGPAVTGAAVTGAAVTGAAVTGTGAAVNGAAKGGKSAVSAELQAILQEDAKQYPLWAWALLCVMTVCAPPQLPCNCICPPYGLSACWTASTHTRTHPYPHPRTHTARTVSVRCSACIPCPARGPHTGTSMRRPPPPFLFREWLSLSLSRAHIALEATVCLLHAGVHARLLVHQEGHPARRQLPGLGLLAVVRDTHSRPRRIHVRHLRAPQPPA